MLPSVIHADYEISDIVENIHNPRYTSRVNGLIFSAMVVTFITHKNHQRQHFIAYTYIFLPTNFKTT